MINKIYLLYTFLFSLSLSLYSQQETDQIIKSYKDEVDLINSIPLRKAFLVKDENERSNLFAKYTFDDELMTNAIYIDSSNRIRKYIYYTRTETDERTIICYYNRVGEQILLIYNNYYWDIDNPPSYVEIPTRETGYIFRNGSIFLEQDHKLTKIYDDSVVIKRYKSLTNQSILSIDIEQYKMTSHLFANSSFDPSAFKTPSGLQVVVFDGKEGVSFINRNDVFIRQGAGKNYPPDSVLRTIDAGRILQLKPINQKTNKIREDSWCRVTEPFTGVEGYIYSAFLEPIERVIEE